MRICGIVAEYDPFHLGHLYHLSRARQEADCVVAVMAGYVTQRGRCACLDKYERAKMALECGVDAVFELPAFYTVRPAEQFASAGVDILRGIGCDMISFGSEADEETLRRIAALSANEPAETGRGIRGKMDAGMSFIRARAAVYARELGIDESVITRPNTVLGAAYMARNRGVMRELVVPRRGDYYGREMSATGVRQLIRDGKTDEAAQMLPEAGRKYAAEMSARDMDAVTLFSVRTARPEDIACLPDAGEGIENRVKREAETARTRRELVERVSSSRYTLSRVERLLTQLLLGITKDRVKRAGDPAYARLLGFTPEGRRAVSELRERSTIPVIDRVRDIPQGDVFDTEKRAEALFTCAGDITGCGSEHAARLITLK